MSTRARDQFWLLPMLYAAAAALLGVALSELDLHLGTSGSLPFLFTGGPEGARVLLSAIVTSMISFTGLVFSITIVVLQLTSSQFSPRILRTFLRDRLTRTALGVFVATFVYAFVVLRAVRGTANVDPFVPQLALTVAFVFVLASVVVFLAYIHHIAQSIRAATIVARIGDDTRALVDRRHPADAEATPPMPVPEEAATVLLAEAPGVLQRVDDDALAALADHRAVTVELLLSVGEFVPTGAPLLAVHGGAGADEDDLRATVRLGQERSLDQDIGFGLRQLVDIAERALSPGVNDPTTAVQALDQLHDLLRRLATRPLLARQALSSDGRLLVHVPQPAFADYLALGVDEIAHWGADSARIQRRLDVMLDDLRAVARPEHRAVVIRTLAARAQVA